MRVITTDVNDYNQHWEYFVTAFDHEPTIVELMNTIGCNDKLAEHIIKWWWRIDREDNWYYLKMIEQWKNYFNL